MTVLTGETDQSDMKFYIMSTIYIATSLLWWLMLRTFKSVYVLAAPFTFYGLAFFLLALTPFAKSASSTRWLQNIATAQYAAASSSGGFHFAFNFANERAWPQFQTQNVTPD
jgi:alpha-1,3-glucan synthase